MNLDDNSLDVKDILNILLMFNVTHLIHEPTSITSNSATCLDNIMTNVSFGVSGADACTKVVLCTKVYKYDPQDTKQDIYHSTKR
ncbi:hypothetical protein NQ315_014465 [Exocentrus adspersus]|uniref:Uncharacterized protein n=1 Tax=Exocentrus adspersus TaxID=1586481 RepID=A0AAV8VF77_9CUCU|nr:hypothetical protein NQ315_014465 [Exocentrus adspersus]